MYTQDDRDPLLAMWVRGADSGVLGGLGVTLMVGGLIVTGLLVGIHEYMKGIADQFRNAPDDSEALGRALADVFEEAAAGEFGGGEDETPAEGDGDTRAGQVEFVHLKDVRILAPQGFSATVPWWRGRLTAVDAFVYGTAEQS